MSKSKTIQHHTTCTLQHVRNFLSQQLFPAKPTREILFGSPCALYASSPERVRKVMLRPFLDISTQRNRWMHHKL